MRVFEEASQTPVMVMGELPQNTSTSVTNMAEYLAPELIQRHFPQRFEELPPAIFLEHYVEERTPEGRLGRKPTWDRLSFHSWAPRRVWLSGQERIAFGDPHWEHLPEHEVEALARPGRDAGAAATGSDSQRSGLKVGAQASIRRGADVKAIPKVSGVLPPLFRAQRPRSRVSYVVPCQFSSFRVVTHRTSKIED